MMDTRKIQIRNMPVDLWRQVRLQAAREGMTMRDVVVKAIQDYLRRAA